MASDSVLINDAESNKLDGLLSGALRPRHLKASSFPYRKFRGVYAFQLPTRAIGSRITAIHLPLRSFQFIAFRRFYNMSKGQSASPKSAQLLRHKPEDVQQWVDGKAEENRRREHRRRMRDSNPPHRGKYALCDALEDVENALDVLEDMSCLFDHDIKEVKSGRETIDLDENEELGDAINNFGYAVVGLGEVIDERVPVVMNNAEEEHTQTHDSYISQDK